MNKKRLGCSLLFALFILINSVASGFAQDDDDDEDLDQGKTVSLNVTIRQDGNAYLRYTHFESIADLQVARTALASATGCPASSFVQPAPDFSGLTRMKNQKQRDRLEAAYRRSSLATLESHCSRLVKRQGLISAAKIDIAPLLQFLKPTQTDSLWITMYHPEQGSNTHSNTYVATQYGTDTTTASFTIPVQTATPTVLEVRYGYTQRDIARMGGILAGFIILPVGICFWVRRKALALGGCDPTAAWFSYFRAMNLCVNGVFLFWMLSGSASRRGMVGLVESLSGPHKSFALVATLALTILPPWIVYFICLSGSYRVLVQIRGIEWKFREFLLAQLLTVSVLMVPIVALVSGVEIWHTSSRAGFTIIIVGWLLMIVCARLKTKVTKTQPEPLSTGELRDRIFDLAKRAGVTLKHIFVMPAGKMQVANAYAAANQVVTFTDYVLQRLTKREVDAIAGHEISHLKHKHPGKLGMTLLLVIFLPRIVPTVFSIFLGFTGGIIMAATRNYALYGKLIRTVTTMWQSPFADPIILASGLLGFFFVARRFERTADEGAVQLTADPEALITGLLKLNQLNLMPFQWGKATGLLLTHPSTLKRIHRIAAAGNVPSERVQQILSDYSVTNTAVVADPTQYYLVPEVAKDRVVTTADQVQKAQSNLLVLLLAHVAPPAFFAWLAQRTVFGSANRPLVYLAGAFISLFAYILLMRTLALRGRSKLSHRFEQKFRRQGLLLDYSKARVVGFSPGPYPRFYLSSWNWDNGLLIFRRGALIFLGDQVRFRIPVDAIKQVCLAKGSPGFLGIKRVYLQWTDPESGATRWLNMANLDPCSPFGLSAQPKNLLEVIQHWRNNQAAYRNPPDEFLKLTPPSSGEITCIPPSRISTFKKESSNFILFLILSWAAVTVARVDAFSYVIGVVLLLRAYEFIPYKLYRDRAPDGTPVPFTAPQTHDKVPAELPTT